MGGARLASIDMSAACGFAISFLTLPSSASLASTSSTDPLRSANMAFRASFALSRSEVPSGVVLWGSSAGMGGARVASIGISAARGSAVVPSFSSSSAGSSDTFTTFSSEAPLRFTNMAFRESFALSRSVAPSDAAFGSSAVTGGARLLSMVMRAVRWSKSSAFSTPSTASSLCSTAESSIA